MKINLFLLSWHISHFTVCCEDQLRCVDGDHGAPCTPAPASPFHSRCGAISPPAARHYTRAPGFHQYRFSSIRSDSFLTTSLGNPSEKGKKPYRDVSSRSAFVLAVFKGSRERASFPTVHQGHGRPELGGRLFPQRCGRSQVTWAVTASDEATVKSGRVFVAYTGRVRSRVPWALLTC
ncbi:hypothetical protein SKAU_G00314830 [Synaphobranchus kaupii]|uniref:Secreted protein n=1 Tax=Synaphobranchus kaupii TaxID=118154 RepID=A0A9Q1IJH9_SYNKA|nr:hypothetical protein SKAU_G00314830 [Synaphobranchus kaupii]